MYRFGISLFVIFALCSVFVVADATYDIILDDSGDAIVLLSIDESGTYSIPLPSDVVDIKVKGALYFIEDNVLELSIGSTNHALVLFKTAELTDKKAGIWTFAMDTITDTSQISVNLPQEARITETNPKVLIDDTDYKKIVWDVTGFVSASYSFTSTESTLPSIEDFGNSDEGVYSLFVVTGGITILIILIAVAGYIILHRKKEDEKEPLEAKEETESIVVEKEEKQEKKSEDDPKLHIIKTLSKNEAAIVQAILDNDNGMKRSELERTLKIAKSSLASSLHNLEQKNIVIVDKTHTAHYISFTEWFKEL